MAILEINKNMNHWEIINKYVVHICLLIFHLSLKGDLYCNKRDELILQLALFFSENY